jgi:DNA replicative helicase MCM subunit Mcm2 (Cdc46/Mcm family)
MSPSNRTLRDNPQSLEDSPLSIQVLAEAISSSIYGLNDVKKAIICYLVSGSNSEKSGLLNILIIGDPGIGKSKLIESLTKFLPNYILNTGEL